MKKPLQIAIVCLGLAAALGQMLVCAAPTHNTPGRTVQLAEYNPIPPPPLPPAPPPPTVA